MPRSFYDTDPRDRARCLLNKLLVRDGRAGRIVEVEAYAGDEDPASHAFGGLTTRNATMFGPPGHLYVYRSYGIHWCANAVFGPESVAMAVLLRALVPVSGLAPMRAARPAARSDRDLCRGPGRLTQALGITGADDGADLVTGDRGVAIVDDGTPSPELPGVSARVGITRALDRPWRWYVTAEACVSGPRRTGPV
ncbi:MAG: DNA-3-methyladenine glycosylase [Acidimicrobiales bacterium]